MCRWELLLTASKSEKAQFLNLFGYYLTLTKQPDRQISCLVDIQTHWYAHTTSLWPKNSTYFQVDLQRTLLWQALQQNKLLLLKLRPPLCYKKSNWFKSRMQQTTQTPPTLIPSVKQFVRNTSLHSKQSQDSAWKQSSKTCRKLTSAECTVENSWWWAEWTPETCRVS
jgi:hypothetical protein